MQKNKITNEELGDVLFAMFKEHKIPLQDAMISLMYAAVYTLHAEGQDLETEMIITVPCCNDHYDIKLKVQYITDSEREKIKEKVIENRIMTMPPINERKH